MKNFYKLIAIVLSFTLMTLISGCGGGGTTTSSTPTGTLSLSMTDAPPQLEGNVTAVNIAVIGIEYNHDGNWISANDFEPQTFNLLDLQNGKSLHLGDMILPAGHYSEIRFILAAPTKDTVAEVKANPDCNITYADGSSVPLFVPSGGQSGYKGKGAFDITADARIAVTADFDLYKSIVVTGKSEKNTKYILKPVIRLVVTELSGMINGTVVDIADYNTTSDSSLVVYSYKSGMYNSDETIADENGSVFLNAVSAGDVNMTDGNFTLAFLDEGNYSLITAHFLGDVFNGVVDQEDNVEVFKGQPTLVDINTSN